jgi:putative addiction module component (TIGR02574 family)
MNDTVKQLIATALALSESERLQLAGELIVSLKSEERAPLDEKWREIVKRRFAEFRAGPATAVTRKVAKQEKRVLGLHAGMYDIAADFDAPLPDEFWLGES